MARPLALVTLASLLAVLGAGGASAQTPKRGGTVVVWGFRDPPCLNFLSQPCGGGPLLVLGQVLQAPLYEDGRPLLVSSVSFTRKPPFTLVYDIRREARWSDGVPVTARDFVFTDHAIRTLMPRDSEVGSVEASVRSVRALDPKTVRVVLRSRLANWRYLFGGGPVCCAAILPQHLLAGMDLSTIWKETIDDPRTGDPIADGPFLLERWDRGRQLVLARNQHYSGSHTAYLKRIVVRFCRQACNVEEAIGALRRKETDVADFGFALDPDTRAELRGIPGVAVSASPSGLWEHLDINVRSRVHPALGLKLVRRALAYAIDRAAIARAVFPDIAPNLRPSDNAVFSTASRYYRPNWQEYGYRPAYARSLLRQAGCRRGTDGVFVCGGDRLSLRLVTRAGIEFREHTVQLIQRQLLKAGIEVVLSYATSGALFDQILPGGDFDLAEYAWGRDTTGGDAKDREGCGGVHNYGGYCQRLLTSDLDQAARILDDRRRAQVLNRADRRLAQDVPVVPLYEQPQVTVVRNGIRGFAKFDGAPFWRPENWWLER